MEARGGRRRWKRARVWRPTVGGGRLEAVVWTREGDPNVSEDLAMPTAEMADLLARRLALSRRGDGGGGGAAAGGGGDGAAGGAVRGDGAGGGGEKRKRKKKKRKRPAEDPNAPPPPRIPGHHYCEQCGKGFRELPLLKKHGRVHAERKHACPVEGCGKRFVDNSKLKRHLVVHSSDRR